MLEGAAASAIHGRLVGTWSCCIGQVIKDDGGRAGRIITECVGELQDVIQRSAEAGVSLPSDACDCAQTRGQGRKGRAPSLSLVVDALIPVVVRCVAFGASWNGADEIESLL